MTRSGTRELGDRCRCRGGLYGLALVVLYMSAPLSFAQEGDAAALLKAMSDYLDRQRTIELRFDSAIEVITPAVEKIQFASSGEATLSRPNRLHARRLGGYADVALFFDGDKVNVYGRHLNGYAQFRGPTTVDELIDALRAGHGVALPGADLLRTGAYELLMADVEEAKYLGRGVIGGRQCEHLAFRNFDTDWQLWIEAGDEPIPRKLVITSKTINSAPQYSVVITEWSTGGDIAPERFTFTAPPDAEELDANALIELDELPPDSPRGEIQ